MSILPTRILLATDGSRGAELAATAAVDLSKRTGAELHVVHAWRPLPHYAYRGLVLERYKPPYEEGARRLLAGRRARIEKAGGVAEAHLVAGRPADAVLDLGERLGADLIVVGSRGAGPVGRLLVGSVSVGIVHHARCAVLVARGGAWPPVRVVIGEDLSGDAHGAASLGVELGKLIGAEALLAHAYEGMPPHPETLPRDERELYERMVEEHLRRAEQALALRASELADAHGVRPGVRIVSGYAARALSEIAEEGGGRGLVVLGARGLGASERMLLGSVSTGVLGTTSGPVLVCPRGRAKEAPTEEPQTEA